MHLYCQIHNLQLLILYMDGQEFLVNLDYVLLWYNQSKIFLYYFIIFLHLISSFLHTRSVLVPVAYVSIKSIDYILSSSFELKDILLISSVKTLCLSLLNLFCAFDISFFTNSFWSPLRLSTRIFIFFLNSYFTLYSSCF